MLFKEIDYFGLTLKKFEYVRLLSNQSNEATKVKFTNDHIENSQKLETKQTSGFNKAKHVINLYLIR